MNLNITAWLSAAWWRTPISPQQGGAGNDFDKPVSLLAMILTGIAGVVAMGLNPVIATAYVDFLGFSEAQAGYVLAADMSGAAIGTLLVSARVHIWNRRVTAVCGLTVLLAGNLACLALAAFDSLLIARFIIGTGAGIAAGSMAAGIAATGNPDRYFGVYTVVTLSTGAMLMALAPLLLTSFSIRGLFSLLACMALPAFCLVRQFPEFTAHRKMSAGGKPASWRDLPLRTLLVISATTLVYYIGTGSVWPYMSLIGKAQGLTIQATGNLLAVAQLFGVAGALVPAVLGTRLGRMAPISFSLLVSTGCLLALLMFANRLVYALVVQLYMFVWLMFFPYLMGIVSELGPVGRLAGVSYALQSIGFAIGPALAALLIPGGGYAALFYLGIGCYLATLLLLLSLSRNPGADARTNI